MGYLDRLDKAAGRLQKWIRPQVTATAVVLGSGWGTFAQAVDSQEVRKTSWIREWPVSTVPGHGGEIIKGHVGPVSVIVLSGRVHLYEGYSAADVVFPIRVLGRIGIKNVVLTNAAGGIRPDLVPGNLLLISDHINELGVNPLAGFWHPDLGSRFPDMSGAYDPEFIELSKKAAKAAGMKARTGILAACLGPSYETPAEVKALARLGADAVCMSTVPEVIAARQMGMRVSAVSLITNRAAGLDSDVLSHEEVRRAAAHAGERLSVFLKHLLVLIQGLERS
jgi:purine-nucleoside phosphorylase